MSSHGWDDMRSVNGVLRAVLVRAGAAALLTVGLAGCSMLPGWAGGTDAAPTQEGTTGFPDLADTPDKAPAATSASDQKAIADSLAADRADAKHTDEVLRGGTETPAPPPQVTTPKPVPALKDVPADETKPDKQSMNDLPLIPMPPIGGHATLAEAKRIKTAEAEPAKEEAAKPEASEPSVDAAPTTPVEVKPSAGTAQP